MSVIPKVTAHYDSVLVADLTNPLATSFTVLNPNDEAGNPLSGVYSFTLDRGTSVIETILGTINPSSNGVVTIVLRGCDPNNPNASDPSLIQPHTRGADVTITDYGVLGALYRLLSGIDTLDNILSYTSAPNFTLPLQIIDKAYVDAAMVGGGVPASETVPGISMAANQTDIDTANDQRPYNSILYDLFVTPSQLAASVPPATVNIIAAAAITRQNPVYVRSYTPSGGLALDVAGNAAPSFTVPPLGNSSYICSTPITIGNNANRVWVGTIAYSNGGPTGFGMGALVSATLGGLAVTIIDSVVQPYQVGSNSYAFYQYTVMLVAPPIGTSNLVMTVNASNGSSVGSATFTVPVAYESLYNASQSSTPDAHGLSSNSNTNTNFTFGITTVTAGAWVTGWNAWVSTFIGGTMPNHQQTVTGGAAFNMHLEMGDAGVIGSPGLVNANISSGTNQGYSIGLIAIAPFSSSVFAVDLASSATTTTSDTYIGFPQASYAQDGVADIQTAGIVGGFSGLVAGDAYYIQDTAGTIASTPGTVTKKCGVAISATELLIVNS